MPYKKITQAQARRMKRVCDAVRRAKFGEYIGPCLTSFELSESGKAIFSTAKMLHNGLFIAKSDGTNLRIYAAKSI